MTEETLTDGWLKRLKNNPIIAVLIIAGVGLAAIFSFWNQLPRGLRDWVSDHISSSSGQVESPNMGWVFAGYADKDNELRWASPARIRLSQQSGGADRPHIFRVGDIVQPIEQVHQVIADFRTAGLLHQMESPVYITEEIRKKEDWTGRVYDVGTDLEVLDVSVSQVPGLDWAVWLRVTPMDDSR